MPVTIADPLTLPCGAVLKNRLSKAAMTEGIATPDNRATAAHAALYGRWSDGGAGLLITGNVQVDRRFLERPGNVAADGNGGLEEMAAYARAGSRNGNHIWMQINHPGRQAGTGTETFVSPSENTKPGKEGMARALEADEIEDIINRFVHVAKVAQDTGFTGVQVHAAHGYLLSQFVSPLTNRRTDKWGGSLENRARALLEVVRRTRAAVGRAFPVSVKLNSSDFQKGGTTEEESFQVIEWLNDEGIDLLEVSGGNYESTAMVGRNEDGTVKQKAASTSAREAYFLDFAARLRPVVKVPLMVTGGFRTLAGMQDALASGAMDVVGLGRPLCIDPDYCNKLLDGSVDSLPSPDMLCNLDPAQFGDPAPELLRLMEVAAGTAYYFNQIVRLADGKDAEQDIDWNEQLKRITAFDEALNERYLENFKPAVA
ncbi:MAG: NADH:flavin oxidoreductase/NADH oxidase family protein [Novosphingobium sp.]